MKHVFIATLLGWDSKKKVIHFDSEKYTREEAEAQFKPYRGTNQRGYPYTGYEYAGDKFYDYKYVDEFEDRYDTRKPKEVDYYNWKKIFGE
jgi:hypothetical protein